MIWLGVFSNVIAIILGAVAGHCLQGRIPRKIFQSIIKILGVCVVILGIQSALQFKNIWFWLGSIVLGGLFGEFLSIEERIELLTKRFTKDEGSDTLIQNPVLSASVLFCVGAMAILGSLESGLRGSHGTLFAKALIDCFLSLSLAANYGLMIAFSALPVLIYEGALTAAATPLSEFILPTTLNEISGVGGVLLIGTGLRIAEVLDIRVGNYLPAIPIVVLLSIIFPGINL